MARVSPVVPCGGERRGWWRVSQHGGRAQPPTHRFVWVKEEQDDIGTLGEPPDDAREVVPAVPRRRVGGDGFVEVPAADARVHRRVDHAGAVNEHDVFQSHARALFQGHVVDKRAAKGAQPCEAQVRIPHQRWSIPLAIFVGRGNDREAVVGGGHPSLLHRLSCDVVDEGALPGGVVAQHQHQGLWRALIAALLQWPQHCCIQRRQELIMHVLAGLVDVCSSCRRHLLCLCARALLAGQSEGEEGAGLPGRGTPQSPHCGHPVCNGSHCTNGAVKALVHPVSH